MKYFVVAIFIAIVGSLLSGLIFLVRDKGTTNRTVKALTVRVALSVFLFALLMIGYWLGLIHGKLGN
jgi:DUF2909 family protein